MKKQGLFLTSVLALSLACFGCGASGQSAGDANTKDETASEETVEAADGEKAALDLKGFYAPHGGSLEIKLQPADAKELSEDEKADIDRAIRAYTPSGGDSLIINEAKSFYYYEQLDAEAQSIYEAIMMLTEDPTSEDLYIAHTCTIDPRSEDFRDEFFLAQLAVLYDHPELFWLYNGTETDVVYGYSKAADDDTAYIFLEKPYRKYKKQMKAFNKAAKEFLADIDLTQSDSDIALQIHDKLGEMVTYDTAAASTNSVDLAHTAYGALVKNSSGEAHMAVCDGYSLAYEYLLQQAGIDASVVVGVAGGTESDAGNHAWSLAKLDGDWYEVDTTWDDNIDDYKAAAQGITDDLTRQYVEEALDDADYSYKLSHYLCNHTTPNMEDFVAENWNDLYYTTKDGKYQLVLASDSVHIRADDDRIEDDLPYYADLVELLPEADGSLYTVLH